VKTNHQPEPTVFALFGGAGDLAWFKTMLGARFCAATHPRRRVKTVSGGLRGKDAPDLSLAGHYLMAMPGMLFIIEKRRKGEK
jgi:hypothetical protein